MRITFVLVALMSTLLSATSCKSKKATASSNSTAPAETSSSSSTPGVSGGNVTITTSETSTNTTASGENQGANVGKVSHKYRATGCSSVIVFNAADGTEVVIIPKDKLNADIDVDGQTIKFDYHPLKMPQPVGCTTGMPAEVSNITKLK